MSASTIRKDVVYSISFAHMLNDWYMNIIPILTPFFIAAGFGIGEVSFAISAFTITLFTFPAARRLYGGQKKPELDDLRGHGLVGCFAELHRPDAQPGHAHWPCGPVGPWRGGLSPAGFGHGQRGGRREKGLYQAVFGACGNLGWALTPLFVIPLVERYGLSVTPYFVVPGIIVTALLAVKAQKTSPRAQQAQAVPLLEALRPASRELTKLVLIIAVRTLTYSGLVAFYLCICSSAA